MNTALRKRLQELTTRSRDSLAELPALVLELATEIPHSVELAPNPPLLPIADYNCIEFALGLAGHPQVHLLSNLLPSTSCNTEFASLLASGHLTETEVPSVGDLILYCDTKRITHAGIVSGSRITSKWGFGQLWLHGVFEVPAQYGDTVRFYRPLPPLDALAHLIEFFRVREGKDFVNSLLAQ